MSLLIWSVKSFVYTHTHTHTHTSIFWQDKFALLKVNLPELFYTLFCFVWVLSFQNCGSGLRHRNRLFSHLQGVVLCPWPGGLGGKWLLLFHGELPELWGFPDPRLLLPHQGSCECSLWMMRYRTADLVNSQVIWKVRGGNITTNVVDNDNNVMVNSHPL